MPWVRNAVGTNSRGYEVTRIRSHFVLTQLQCHCQSVKSDVELTVMRLCVCEAVMD